jgi:hypothetical protein
MLQQTLSGINTTHTLLNHASSKDKDLTFSPVEPELVIKQDETYTSVK